MNPNPSPAPDMTVNPNEIIGLNYVSLYVEDFEAAIAFYTQIFGVPAYIKRDTFGWQMGTTWLTMFSSTYGTAKGQNPCNAEFAIQVATPDAVDRLYQRFRVAGAKEYCPPEDTMMYEPMRFACIDDPFGMRIDIYCPLATQHSET